LTTLTEKHFREDYEGGDNFIRTVLTHGLLVLDHHFAHEFYAHPYPQPDSRALQYRKDIQERVKSRLMFFIKEDALEDGRKALSSLAVAVGRSMLEQLGVLPAGKRDWLKAFSCILAPTSPNWLTRFWPRKRALTSSTDCNER